MARFVLTTGVAPSEYKRLTRAERQAFFDVIERSKTGG